MKKYITIAALLAAGSAFANALTITEDTTMAPGGNFYAGAFDFSFEIAATMDNLYLLGYYASTSASGDYSGNVFTLTKDETTDNYTLSLDRVASLTVTNNDITGVGTIHNSSVFKANDANYVLTAGNTYTVQYKGGNNNEAAADLLLDGTVVASFIKGKHNMNGGGGDGSATLNVKVNSAVIPEPSVFGLLAGLGALALVGTRRRRR